MPAKSARQFRLMQAVSKGGSLSKGNDSVGPSKAVADKFIKETPAKKRRLFMKQKK